MNSRSPSDSLDRLEARFDLSLTKRQRHQVIVYRELLEAWNRRMNLTRLLQPEEQLRLHFFESFWVAHRFLSGQERLVDVGSGAGFPGLAFKLYHADLELTLIEPALRKSIFLEEACRVTGLQAQVTQRRAEDFADWDGVELVSIRALRPSRRLQETLIERGVGLLILHGEAEPALDPRWKLIRREVTPESRCRYAGLYRSRREGL